MKAIPYRVQLVFAVVLLAAIGSALALVLLPGAAHAQTRVPPLPTRLAPLRATPVTPDMSCVHLTTDGAPGASFVGGAIRERCFAFPGDAGSAVTIVLQAAAGAAPAMELRGPAGEVVARGKNGQITGQALKTTGPYALIVSGADLPKAVRVEVSVVAPGGIVRPTTPPSGDATSSDVPPSLCGGVLRPGQTHTDLLPLPGLDCRYTFEGRSGQALSIWMESRSDGLRPEITLLDPTGNVLDRGHAIDARTRYASILSLPAGGTYTVIAGSQSGQSAGPFTLRLERVAGATCGDTLTVSTVTEVELAAAGRRCELFIDVPGARPLRVSVRPLDGAAQPGWLVIGPTGNVAASSDSNAPGQFADQAGRYRLRLAAASRQSARVLVQVSPPQWMTVSQQISCGGALTASASLPSNAHMLPFGGGFCSYDLNGLAGDTVWIAVSVTGGEDSFQPVVTLLAPGYRLGDAPEASGDDSVFTGMSVIGNHTLAQSGRYTVRVSDDGDDDTGSYFIRLWQW